MTQITPNSTIQTSCKNCAFAIYTDDTQTGCSHNRIEKFGDDVISAYDKDSEFYVIKRFCNYYRNKIWGYSEEDVSKVVSESATTYSLFFDCDELYRFEPEFIIEFINSIEYDKNKLSITLFHDSNNHSIVKNFVSTVARKSNKKTEISVCNDDKYVFLHKRNIQQPIAFHGLINTFALPEINFAQTIDDMINKDLAKVFAFESNSVIFANNYIYKAISYMDECKNYTDNISKLVDSSIKLNNYIKL